ncbi:MAG: hypothetical protein WAZ14_01140 [Patescibacteria group bacterium]
MTRMLFVIAFAVLVTTPAYGQDAPSPTKAKIYLTEGWEQNAQTYNEDAPQTSDGTAEAPSAAATTNQHAEEELSFLREQNEILLHRLKDPTDNTLLLGRPTVSTASNPNELSVCGFAMNSEALSARQQRKLAPYVSGCLTAQAGLVKANNQLPLGAMAIQHGAQLSATDRGVAVGEMPATVLASVSGQQNFQNGWGGYGSSMSAQVANLMSASQLTGMTMGSGWSNSDPDPDPEPETDPETDPEPKPVSAAEAAQQAGRAAAAAKKAAVLQAVREAAE